MSRQPNLIPFLRHCAETGVTRTQPVIHSSIFVQPRRATYAQIFEKVATGLLMVAEAESPRDEPSVTLEAYTLETHLLGHAFGETLPFDAMRVCFINCDQPTIELPQTEAVKAFKPGGELQLEGIGIHVGKSSLTKPASAELGLFFKPKGEPITHGAEAVAVVIINGHGAATAVWSERFPFREAVIASLLGVPAYKPYGRSDRDISFEQLWGRDDAYEYLADELQLLPEYLMQLARAMHAVE